MSEFRNILKLSGLSYFIMVSAMLVLKGISHIDILVCIANILIASIYLMTLVIAVNSNKYCSKNLIILVFLVGLLFVFVNDVIFYLSTNSFFSFGAIDSLQYHNAAIFLNHSDASSNTIIVNGDKEMGFDDIGFAYYISALYLIIESPLFVNFINVILAVMSAYMLYDIAQLFMSRRSAYLSSLTYSLASYVMFFAATGLKEILMVTIIIASFYFFYKYVLNKNILLFLLSILFCTLLFFFRIPLFFFVMASYASYYFFSKNNKNFSLIVFVFAVLLGCYVFYMMQGYLDRYFVSFSDLTMYKSHGEQFKGLPPLLISVISFCVGVIGPLPTMIPYTGSENLSFFASGLTLKLFMGLPFFLGVVYIVRNKIQIIAPLAMFCILEVLSISFLWESFELRKVFPHICFFFLIAFYFLEQKESKQYSQVYMLSYSILFVMMLAWNLR